MIALALLLLTGTDGSAQEAERAFALKAQTDGQWTAFRAYAADDAVMFAPEKVNTQAFLKNKPNPPQSVMWWPGTVFPSCDGDLAVSTGPWVIAANGTQGTFTTVWKRQADGGWKWLLDHGRDTPKIWPAGQAPTVREAACAGATPANAKAREEAFTERQLSLAEDSEDAAGSMLDAALAADTLVQREGALPALGRQKLPVAQWGEPIASGHSADWTLAWDSHAIVGAAPGAHDLRVWQWRGEKGWMLALYDITGVKAP